MGNTFGWSPAGWCCAFIRHGNEHGVEVDRPDAVVRFVQPDLLIDEGSETLALTTEEQTQPAMAVTNSFQSFVLEQLARALPAVRSRRMFGGVGIYSNDLFFALIDDDAVYLKTDATTQQDFEARGMGPFRPAGDDGETMAYHQLPEDILESPEALRLWADKALAVARQAKGKRSRRRRD